MMDRKMMIVGSAVMLAAIAAAVVVGSAPADSDATVYGTDVQPYAGIDASYYDLEDGATYYIVKGGYVSISFLGIEAEGMETDLAGSGLVTDYADERIYGKLEASATVTIGEKTVSLMASNGTPAYGYTKNEVDKGWLSTAYMQKAYSESIDITTDTYSNAWVQFSGRITSVDSTQVSAYGLSLSLQTISETTTKGNTYRITVYGTPVAGADDIQIKIDSHFIYQMSDQVRCTYTLHLKIVDTFTINYHSNGGSCSKSSDTVKYGSTITLPTATRDDHSFLGWYTQASGGICRGTSNDTYDPIAHYTVDQTINLYAQWEEDTSPVTSISISGATSVKVGNSITLTARTYPDDAKDHRVNWYVNSGSGYVSITSTTDMTSGGTCTIKGLANGTATIRAVAQDGSDVYKDYTITVTEEVVSYSFTLRYNANGGTGAPSSFSTTSTGTTYNASVSTVKPTWSGHTFIGWSTDSSSTTADYVGGNMITLRSGDLTTLYAIWQVITTTWTLSFDANGGSGAPGKMTALEAGSSHKWTLPATTPTLSGYSFAGWARSNTATVGAYQPGGECVAYMQDATLYAVWEAVKTTNTFKVIFDDGEGTGGPGTMEITDDASSKDMRIPDTQPTRAGYEFLGWGISAGTSTVAYYPGETYTFNSGTTTLFAVWKQYTYVLTLYPTDESGSYKTIEGVGVGEVSVTIPSDYIPVRTGYTFDGWKTKDGSITYQPGQVIKLTEDLSLYGKWVGSGEVKPSVRFNVTSDESQSVTVVLEAAEDGTYKFPDYSATREGYTFLGWADIDGASASVYSAGDKIDMSTPKVLQVYAVWKIEGTTWTLSFDANLGSGAPGTISMSATSSTTSMSFQVPAATLIRSGYTFIGWDDNKDASTKLVDASGGTYISRIKDATLYAVWQIGDPESYTITFDVNGGSGGPGTATSVGAVFEIPDVTPIFAGHVFVGWEWNNDGTVETVVPGVNVTITLVDKETVLKAVWKEIAPDTVFDIVFNVDGGSEDGISTQSMVSSAVPAKFTIPSGYTPTKSGCEFLGWSLSKNGEDRHQPGETVELVSETTVLYAVWKSTSVSAPELKWTLTVDGATLTFDGSASLNVKSWVWDFGDGSSSSEKSGTHTYDKIGTYTVKLIVYSDSGLSSICTKNVVISEKSGSVAEKGIGVYVIVAIVAILIVVVALRFAGVF